MLNERAKGILYTISPCPGMRTRTPFEKEGVHVANTLMWVALLTSFLKHLQYAYFLFVHLLNHNLCKPKSTMFVYFSRTEGCSFFRVKT